MWTTVIPVFNIILGRLRREMQEMTRKGRNPEALGRFSSIAVAQSQCHTHFLKASREAGAEQSREWSVLRGRDSRGG